LVICQAGPQGNKSLPSFRNCCFTTFYCTLLNSLPASSTFTIQGYTHFPNALPATLKTLLISIIIYQLRKYFILLCIAAMLFHKSQLEILSLYIVKYMPYF
jgi:hypothetical protein